MSKTITTNPDSLSPGQIQFLDSVTPPLTVGAYTLTAQQDIDGLTGGETVEPYTMSQPLQVTAPRFAIDPSTIQQVFPPQNQQGNFGQALPNIVFSSFALPWMRPITPDATEDETPWMGILTLSETEMPVQKDQPEPPGYAPTLSLPVSMTVEEFLHPTDGSVLPPTLPNILPDDGDMVLATDMNLAFFRKIAPQYSELPFLAHARQVNTDGKVILNTLQDGCFSLVTGNRLPPTQGGTNTALLVSFEGHKDHLPDGGPIDPKYTTIRLAILGSWQFRVNETPGSFIDLMGQLCETGRGGVHLMQMDGPPDDGTADAMAKEALDIGYVPLQNTMRVGEVATSLYRGPFVPQPTVQTDPTTPYYFSDHAIYYDPDYGIFNDGYAAAWQMGRLLALSDATFVRQINDWRRTYAASVQGQSIQDEFVAPMSLALHGATAADTADGRHNDWHHDQHHDRHQGEPGHETLGPLDAAVVAGLSRRMSDASDTIPVMVPREDSAHLARMPGAAKAMGHPLPEEANGHRLSALHASMESEESDSDLLSSPSERLRKRLRGVIET